MISKALVAYYILALSKRDLKPFSKIEKCPSWFCRLLLFSKIAPGGPNNPMKLIFSKTTNKKFGKKIWDFVFFLAQPPMSPVLRALASPGKD